jgi:hypothetical protein
MRTTQEIDARICKAEQQITLLTQEIHDLKTARNALAPFSRLPDELLLHIACSATQQSVERGSIREVLSLTWICRWLRALFVDAPEMWTRIPIDIFAHDRAAVRCCVGRASSRNLDILVNANGRNISSNKDISFMLECLGKAGACYWQWMDLYIMTAMSGRLLRDRLIYPMLHKITFIDCQARGDLFSAYQALFPNLTTLDIEGLRHNEPLLPGIPTLRTLRLHNSIYPLRVLHAFFLATSSLESIDISCFLQQPLLDSDCVFGVSSGPVHLPKLSHLKIAETIECTALLVHILPNPSNVIHLDLLEEDEGPDLDRTQESSSRSLIDRRMRAFWGSLAGSPLKGIASYGGYKTDQLQMRFEGANLSHGTCNGFPITSLDPLRLWENVHTLELYSLGEWERDGIMQHIVAPHRLWGVETVVVRDIYAENCCYVEDIEHLEDWLLARGRQGQPLQSLIFQHCDEDFRPLFDRLVEGHVALSAVWK